MSALTRSLLSKFSQLHINPSTRLHVGTCCEQPSSLLRNLSAFAVLNYPVIRTLRSSVSNDGEGAKMNVAQESRRPQQEVVGNKESDDLALTEDVIAKVNNQIESSSHGRLFAVIHFAGLQRRVTDGDLIMIDGTHPTEVGDVIRAEKVLLVGSTDFTLFGRPLLRPDLVRVEGTIVEKSLTHTKTHFKKKRRKNYKRINFYRHHFSILRINCVRFEGLVDQRPEVEGVDGRVF